MPLEEGDPLARCWYFLEVHLIVNKYYVNLIKIFTKFDVSNGSVVEVNSKQKGDIAVGRAISHYISMEYEVCLPIGDKRDYDFIIEKNGEVRRVQVKFAYYSSSKKRCVVALRITGGNQSFMHAKTYSDTAFDDLFVCTEMGEIYVLPWKEITCRNEIAIEIPKYKVYKVSSCVGGGVVNRT